MFFDQRPNTWIRAICVMLATELGTSGCRDPMPCPDCDDGADDMPVDDMPETMVPDLPCGGADLLTDPRNCGGCGDNCLEYPGTEWEVGSCQMGVCRGPTWGTCSNEAWGATCEELCAVEDRSCVAKGCSGHTALVFRNEGDFDACRIPDDEPDATMDGPCDEPIDWTYESGFPTQVLCCCGW
jgi:hypothetical protein